MNTLSRLRRVLALGATGALMATGLITLAPVAQAAGDGLIINEFYGRGGSANQPYTHKFVELYNPTDAAVNLAGTSLQYRSATGTGNASGVTSLSGTVPAEGYFLIQLPGNAGNGETLPTPDLVGTINPSGTTGTIFLAETTSATSPDNLDLVIDKLGYGGSNSPEGTAAAYPGTNATPGSLTRTGFIDTDDNAADFTFSEQVTPQNSGGDGGDPDPEPEPEPEPVELTIAEIQGTGSATPYAGQEVTTQGVVTAAYPTGGFRGVYLQTPGSGGAAKVPGDASDGIFVFSDWAAENLQIGDCVDVEGQAGEFNGLTQLSQVFVTPVQGCAAVTPTALDTLPATDAEKEVYEGMLVHPQGTYTITNNYALNQYGQIGLAVGEEPLYTATDVVRPGAEAEAYEAENLRRYITLDDGSSWNYLSNRTAQDTPLPYLSAEEPHRTGSHVTFDQPVILDYRFQWNYQPTGQVVGADSPFDPIVSENDREYEVPEVGGNIQIGAFNVLNYFTDLGEDEPGCRFYADREGNPVGTNFCEVRGAWSQAAFEDQQAKIVAAINEMDADVLGLQEIEANSALSYKDLPRDVAMADLVGALNEAAGFTRWAYVPSPRGQVPANEDIIRTGFIYNPSTVQLLGPSQILLDDAFANARYPLAQKFKARQTGNPFVAINNHFKSKGSGEDDGTGQGLANPSREAQSRALTEWVDSTFNDEAVFLMGDFNAYSKETPVQIIEAAGFTNTAKTYEPDSTTYQFSGRLGSLDHVFANDKAMRLVTGAAVWDINGDESIAFQYSRRNYNVVDFHADDPFASSDHDPMLVGLETGPRGKGKGKGGRG
ncbi:ExeM/NucH family extracellular endonuclease [Ornithinimicrobium pratense]|uniref:ExeM/NucH family extracellular endonuclease n=1 Tax=Ornithinimicrobium pratense TaxID=2593973 RepID=A0A5J6V5J1_9MICO|nr:ExeM/NucH family extracellular endonuclease [Ornithinimicrobium pratense]QFG69045.1 ExeM/NucH family extracellular endonuclease [Ornithinimicrobium pratense]